VGAGEDRSEQLGVVEVGYRDGYAAIEEPPTISHGPHGGAYLNLGAQAAERVHDGVAEPALSLDDDDGHGASLPGRPSSGCGRMDRMSSSEVDEPHRPWPGHWFPFGATPDDDGTNFALWAEGATSVELCLFDDNQHSEDGPQGPDGSPGGMTETRFPLTERTYHVWHGYVPGVRPGQRYGYRAEGPWDPERGQRFNSAKLLLDPYARAIDGPLVYEPAIFGHEVGRDDTVIDPCDSAAFVPKSVVVRDGFDWGDDRPPKTPWGDTTIYEMHVRGFTRQHPGVPEDLRGTYAGLAHPAAIEHLTGLGVTAVELLPVHHFVDEEHLVRSGLTNYWGYNSIGYFAPHGPYAASGTRGEQVSEFKAMVKALHAAGLEVILDVVYNHTGEGGETGPTLAFRGLGNNAYYRLVGGGRRYADYTGTGNTLNVREPHVLQLVMDSLRYWVEEMHVDGFRFDLASALARSMHDVDMLGSFLTTIQQDPVLSRVKLIAEPWDIGEGGYQVGEFPPLWSEWNDKFRDSMRDFWRGAGSGVRELGYRLSGSSDLYGDDGRRPYSSINFITAHDGFTLRDLVSYNRKHNEANDEGGRDGNDNNRSWNHGVEGETDDPTVLAARRRSMRNLLASLMLSTGVPMLVAGDELGRTQGGNNNAYCQDNPTSWLSWDTEPWQADLHEWAIQLLALRRKHPVLRHRHFLQGQPIREGGPKDLAWFRPTGGELGDEDWWSPSFATVGMYLSGEGVLGRGRSGERLIDDSLLLTLNASADPSPFVLPGAPWASGWVRVLDTADDRPTEHTDAEGATATLAGRSLALFRALPSAS